MAEKKGETKHLQIETVQLIWLRATPSNEHVNLDAGWRAGCVLATLPNQNCWWIILHAQWFQDDNTLPFRGNVFLVCQKQNGESWILKWYPFKENELIVNTIYGYIWDMEFRVFFSIVHYILHFNNSNIAQESGVYLLRDCWFPGQRKH